MRDVVDWIDSWVERDEPKREVWTSAEEVLHARRAELRATRAKIAAHLFRAHKHEAEARRAHELASIACARREPASARAFILASRASYAARDAMQREAEREIEAFVRRAHQIAALAQAAYG
jgi:hypothetical protein